MQNKTYVILNFYCKIITIKLYFSLNILYHRILLKVKKKVLDITGVDCPMTFIKARIFIQENLDYEKTILVKGKKNVSMLKNTLKKNFKIKLEKKNKDIFKLKIIN